MCVFQILKQLYIHEKVSSSKFLSEKENTEQPAEDVLVKTDTFQKIIGLTCTGNVFALSHTETKLVLFFM